MYTQEEIAAATGISRPTVSEWIKDRVDRLDRRTIVRFCTFLECSVGGFARAGALMGLLVLRQFRKWETATFCQAPSPTLSNRF